MFDVDPVSEPVRRVARAARRAFGPPDALALVVLLGLGATPRDWTPAIAGAQSLPTHAANDAADLVARVAAAEAAFAREASAKGMQDAFLTFVADSGVLLAPGGTVTRAMMASAPKRPPDGASLLWHPTWIEASRDGDLAVSTGPFESRPSDTAPASHGQFLTVWTRLPDGSYRYLMDGGIQHGTPTAAMPTVATAVAGTPATGALVATAGRAAPGMDVDAAAARGAVLASDSAYAARAATDWAGAAATAHAGDVRLMRVGRFPIVGRDAARDSIAVWAHGVRTDRKAAFVSRAADLAVVRGRYTVLAAAGDTTAVERGHVVRVWRRTPDHQWQIALEQLLADPKRK